MVDRQSVNFLVEKEIQDITADDKDLLIPKLKLME